MPKTYVADRRQYLTDGRRNPTAGGWMLMVWDPAKAIHVEGTTYPTRHAAREALRSAQDEVSRIQTDQEAHAYWRGGGIAPTSLAALGDFATQEFGLRAFPGKRFRINARDSYVNDSGVQQIVCDVHTPSGWLSFGHDSLAEFLREAVKLKENS